MRLKLRDLSFSLKLFAICLLADALFAIEDYDQGIHHLNTATSIDRTYAVHWDTIGDKLREVGHVADAIAAYEQCYMALPENIETLRKMGDCYRSTGQLEAAHAAYSQVKAKAEECLKGQD